MTSIFWESQLWYHKILRKKYSQTAGKSAEAHNRPQDNEARSHKQLGFCAPSPELLSSGSCLEQIRRTIVDCRVLRCSLHRLRLVQLLMFWSKQKTESSWLPAWFTDDLNSIWLINMNYWLIQVKVCHFFVIASIFGFNIYNISNYV